MDDEAQAEAMRQEEQRHRKVTTEIIDTAQLHPEHDGTGQMQFHPAEGPDVGAGPVDPSVDNDSVEDGPPGASSDLGTGSDLTA